MNLRRTAKLATAETTELSRPYLRRAIPAPRRPRRVAATTGVALLVAGGAAGTYLSVSGGLAVLTSTQFPAPVSAPAQAAAPSVPAVPHRGEVPQSTAPRHQQRRSAIPSVLAAPVPTMPTVSASPQATDLPEATPTPSGSADPAPSGTRSKTPGHGRSPARDTASEQSEAGH